MHANLDALLTATYVLIDDFLPPRSGPGRPPRITDSELITLALAQVFMGLPNDRQFLALAAYRLGHLFPYLPKQPGYSKRMRRLVPAIERTINYLAFVSPGFCDELRLLDSTPIPWGRSRETARRSEFAGLAGYGYCRSHSAYFWGFRLYLLCASDGTPIAFELAPANAPERETAREMLEWVPLAGHTVIADKGFAGAEFEAWMADRGAIFLRPDRKDEEPRFGSPSEILPGRCPRRTSSRFIEQLPLSIGTTSMRSSLLSTPTWSSSRASWRSTAAAPTAATTVCGAGGRTCSVSGPISDRR